MFSFDIILLFVNVPIRDALNLLSWHFDEDCQTFPLHSYFIFSLLQLPLLQTHRVITSVSPIIVKFLMGVFEELALSRTAYMPTCWFHYVDDTFMVHLHIPKVLNFLNHLNSINPNIQFITEIESDGHLSFLVIYAYRNQMAPWDTQ